MARVHCINCENFKTERSDDGSFTDSALICKAPENRGNWHGPEEFRYVPDKRNANMDCPWYRGMYEQAIEVSDLVKNVAMQIAKRPNPYIQKNG